MPKAMKKMVPVEEEEEETGLHGTTNLEEAKRHAHTMDDALEKLAQEN